MAGGLVHVRVDRHHELEVAEGSLQPVAVGHREGRVPADGHEGPHLPWARRVDLLGQADDGQLAVALGQAAHTAPAPPELDSPPPAGSARRGGPARRGPGEHRAARPVEVAGEDVEHVDQPAGEGAELLRARPDASVHRRRLGRSQLARQAPDGCGVDRSGGRDGLRCEVARDPLHLLDAHDEPIEAAEVDEPFREEHVHHRHEQECVGARPDRHVLARLLGRLGALGVDDDDAAFAFDDTPEPTGPVGRGGEAAVRLERVRTEHQQVRGAVEVGHREADARPEEQATADLLGPLVDRARGVDVRRPEGAHEEAGVEDGRQAVDRRVAEVDRDRVASVLLDDRQQEALDLGERLVPRDRMQLAVLATNPRRTQAIGILVQLLERRALRADETAAEDVVTVAPDAADAAVVLHLDLEATGGLAQRARAKGELAHLTRPRSPPARPSAQGRRGGRRRAACRVASHLRPRCARPARRSSGRTPRRRWCRC